MNRLSFLSKAFLGVAAAIILVLFVGIFSYKSIQLQRESAEWVDHTREVISISNELKNLLLTMETSVRGFALTGKDIFKSNFQSSSFRLRSDLERLEAIVEDNPQQKTRTDSLEVQVYQKLNVMNRQFVELNASQGDISTIQPFIMRGRQLSENINNIFGAIENEEQKLLTARRMLAEESSNTAERYIIIGNGLFLVVILMLSWIVRSTYLSQLKSEKATNEVNESLELLAKEDHEKNWILNGALEIGAAIRGDLSISRLTKRFLKKLAETAGADLAVVYITDRSGEALELTHVYGIDDTQSVPQKIELGKGLLGQVAAESIVVKKMDVVPGYFRLTSGVGEARAGVVYIKSLMFDNQVIAVIELGFLHDPGRRVAKLMEAISESVSATIMAAKERQRTQELLQQTQLQADELLSQQEEMKVINEELSKQTSMLRVSDEELREQQEELKQINTELEEKAFLLEEQNSTIEEARDQMQIKAEELERAGKFKSEFLANMSHELRTPLNSILILSQILRENKGARLSSEEERYASVINTSGNDLLTLINDILDLAKVEAGKVELHYEYVPTESLLQNMRDLFQKMCDNKGIGLVLEKSVDCPELLWVDPVRILQIVRNLLSNAVKFTSAPGSVSLRISKDEEYLKFAVTDTGIGIPLEKQQAIFEAFQQADGSTSRKYGGTGLGLSISKELASLLRGRITLKSEHGRGSEFCLIIPLESNESRFETEIPSYFSNGSYITHSESANNEEAPSRLLIIEDDEIFANDMAEKALNFGFEVVIALTGKEGLEKVKTFKPTAITLDVFLPDISGEEVLDRLKNDSETKHIPVHIVSSGSDALRENAVERTVGIIQKPVDKIQAGKLFELLKLKGSDLSKQRLLLVEDDRLQSKFLGDYLSENDIVVLYAFTAAEALTQLATDKIDGIILDVNLSDRSGLELLDDIKKHSEWNKIPVVINTAEDLSHEDLAKIMRYAHPIVMKTRKSNERLLDEVKQFLRNVAPEKSAPESSPAANILTEKPVESVKKKDAGQKILLADDDMRNIFALSAVLQEEGYDIEIAGNGFEVLEKLNTIDNIGLILMDVMMPEMDGIEATKRIRQDSNWAELPIIAVTAKAMSSDRQLCLDAGASDYISKPLDIEKLMSLIKVWVHSA